jgi:hypothetical protein
MPFMNNRILLTAGLLIVSTAAGITFYLSLKKSSENEPGPSVSSGSSAPADRPAISSAEGQSVGSDAALPQSSASGSSATSDNATDIHSTLDKVPQTAESLFTRADYFKPLNWGPEIKSLAEKENQKLNFKPACNSHSRSGNPDLHPADWAGDFTKTDSLSRWPATSTHVIDWNQFWQLADKGIQVSIRWNFELPARYNVVGYSFALSNPDGIGTAVWQEMPEMTWDEAKEFVQKWEKKTLTEGGKAGTRTMSVTEKPFNAADVSTEEIERAEYSNSRVRAAQSGKMHCASPAQSPAELNCSCGF